MNTEEIIQERYKLALQDFAIQYPDCGSEIDWVINKIKTRDHNKTGVLR